MVLLPHELLPYWKGHDPTLRDIDPASDYGRAGEINDYIGALPVGPGQGIVVSVEGSQVAWMPVSDGEGILVEWGYAEGEASVAKVLSRLPDDIWKDTGILLELTSGRATLFWSTLAGKKVTAPTGEDHLQIRLAPGTYLVSTADHKPDDHTWLLLHRIRKS